MKAFTDGLCAASLSLLIYAFTVSLVSAHSGVVGIRLDSYSVIQFDPNLIVYPGESMTIRANGSVNVNHHYWEERECNWFGLHCWYEKRESSNWLSADKVDIRLRLENGIAAKKNSATEYAISYPVESEGVFTSGSRVQAMIAGDNINRSECTGRPTYCSEGAIDLVIEKIDVSQRLAALEELLNKQTIQSIQTSSVKDPKFIDETLRDARYVGQQNVEKLVTILTKQIVRLRAGIAGNTDPTALALHMKIIELANFSLGLGSKQLADIAQLRLALTESYVDRQDFAQALAAGEQTLGAARESYSNNQNADTALVYGRSLRVNASAWREKQGKNSSTDIRLSIALLEQAIGLLWPFSNTGSVSVAVSDASVDMARMFNLLRTPSELEAGEKALVQAICFRAHAEENPGIGFDDWKADISECVAVDRPVSPAM